MIDRYLKKILVLAFIFIGFFSLSFADISASVDRTSIGKGETVNLVLHLENFNQQPDLSPLDKDFTVYNTSTSSKTTVMNGKTTSSYDMNILLMPNKSGSLTIPKLKVGNEYTNPVSISVSKELSNSEESKYDDVFAIGNVSPKTTYVNSPILYTLKVYYPTPLLGVQMNPLEIKRADIRETGHSAKYQKKINGRMYDVLEQTFLIVPNKTGSLRIPSVVMNIKVAKPFGQFGSTSQYISTKPMRVKVKPIPRDIKVKDWLPSSTVEIKDNWSKEKEIKVGELTTRTVTVAVEGVLSNDIPKLQFKSSDDFNVYPENPQLQDFEKDGRLYGIATYKVGYLATKEGSTTIPELNLKWFDVKSHKSKIAKLEPRTFKIVPGTAAINYPETNPQQTKVVEKVIQDPFWMRLAIIFGALWLITLLLLLVSLRKKKKLNAETHEVQQVSRSSESGNISSIKKACSKKDTFALKEAIISWAEVRYQTQIFSLMDVAGFDQNLEQMLANLDAAIYSNKEFEQFDDLIKLISKANKKDKKKSSDKNAKIKGLYEV